MKRCCAWSGSARRNSRSAAPRRCAANCLRFVFSLIRKKRFDYFITLYQLAARRVPTGKSATPRSCTTRRGLADMADWSGCPSIAAMPSTSRIDVMCQFQKWRRSTYPTRGRSGSSRPRSAGERDPSRASNGNGTKRRRQAETILARHFLSDNVGNQEQCHVNSGRYAGGGVEFAVHRQARVRWRDTEPCEQIARLPMPASAVARKQSGGCQQERTSADAEHVFGSCGLPLCICDPAVIQHGVVDPGTARHDQDVGRFCALARLRRQDRQTAVGSHRLHRRRDEVDRPAGNAHKHLEGTRGVELAHVVDDDDVDLHGLLRGIDWPWLTLS